MTAFLDYISAHTWIGWLVFGLLSLILSRKSQVDAWANANPRAAGVMKFFRALGVDPWMLIQSFSLMVRGRLPVKLQAEKIVEAQGIPVTPEVRHEVAVQNLEAKAPASDPPMAPMFPPPSTPPDINEEDQASLSETPHRQPGTPPAKPVKEKKFGG